MSYDDDIKIIKDNVHGYIRVPRAFFPAFIDTEPFQRLRHIEQTGMRTLFPSARHDRFIHSLGTFHLGSKAFKCFVANIKHMEKRGCDKLCYYYAVADLSENNAAVQRFWDKNRCLFEIACLLHDVGHAPFSHSLEFLYEYDPVELAKYQEKPENGPSSKLLRRLLDICSQSFKDDFKRATKKPGSPHERMSALVVLEVYTSSIKALLEKFDLGPVVDDDVEFIARAIIGCRYGTEPSVPSPLQDQIRNCLIDLLNSNSIDVDGLDYTIRDQELSGIDNMKVDLERLLSGLTLVEKIRFHQCPLDGVRIKGLLDQVVITPLAKEEVSIIGTLRGGLDEVIGADASIRGETSFSAEDATVSASNVTAKPLDGRLLIRAGETNYTTIPNNIQGEKELDFHLTLLPEEELKVKGKMVFRPASDMELTLKAAKVSTGEKYPFINAAITGVITGDVVGTADTDKGQVILQIGYKKGATNILQNVLTARNYEYQWVFCHHKVLYHSTYLVSELLRLGTKYLLEAKMGGTHLKPHAADKKLVKLFAPGVMVGSKKVKEQRGSALPDIIRATPYPVNISAPTDIDINSFFKHCQLHSLQKPKKERTESRSRLEALMKEYYSHCFRKTLWKTYGEYIHFFRDFSSSERKKLFQAIKAQGHFAGNRLSREYGYFTQEWEKEFRTAGMADVVWVAVSSKLKKFKPDEMYIVHKQDNQVFSRLTVLTYREAMNLPEAEPGSGQPFFYLYYNPINNVEFNRDLLVDFFMGKIKKKTALAGKN